MSEQVVCKFNFVCDQKWANLKTIQNNEKARFCDVCEAPVYLTESYDELAVNIAAKRCVAIRAFHPFGGEGEFIGDVAIPSQRHSGVDPLLGRSVSALGVSEFIEGKLRNSGVELIGDLVQLESQALLLHELLDQEEIEQLKDALASRGLTLGMQVENWTGYLERRKKRLG